MPRRDAQTTCRSSPTSGRRAACAPGTKAGGRSAARPATCSRRSSASRTNTISMHQNVDRGAGRSSRSCFDYDGPRRKIVMTGARVPVEPLSVRGLPPLRRRDRLRAVGRSDPRSTSIGFLDAIDERTAARAAVAGAVQERVHHRRASGDREGAPRRRARDPRRLPGRPAPCRWISTAWDADFAVGGSVKWLCGGPGAGYLYVRPDLRGHAEAGVRRLGGARRRRSSSPPAPIRYADGAERFQSGTPNVPSLYSARAGYEIVALDRRAGDPRAVAAPDAPADGRRQRRRLPAQHAGRRRASAAAR